MNIMYRILLRHNGLALHPLIDRDTTIDKKSPDLRSNHHMQRGGRDSS
jgi:hypothetical protein